MSLSFVYIKILLNKIKKLLKVYINKNLKINCLKKSQ